MKRSILLALLACACGPTTGNSLVTFDAAARGPTDAVRGQPYVFDTAAGFQVTLTTARLFVGAVYLNQSNPANYTLEPACIMPGIYTGEVRGALTVDALDPALQPFPVKGQGTDFDTRAGELWLTSGDVDADTDATVVLAVEGTATRASTNWPFSGRVTIGQNRRVPPRNPALPGSNPLCKQRIVSPIPTELKLRSTGALVLNVDPKGWFSSVDFSQLAPDENDASRFAFIDDLASGRQPDLALFNGLKSNTGPYTFSWNEAPLSPR